MRKVLKRSLYLAPLPIVAVLSSVLVLGVAAHPAVSGRGFQSSQGPTHSSVPRIRLHNAGKNSTSTNWSGYAVTGSSYTDVKGSWIQPTVTCGSGETSYSSFWVGIDGDGTNTVEQTGTDADCSSGAPTYYAWYEMYPKFPVNLSASTFTVSPGNQMSAEVSTDGNGNFTLKVSNASRGWTFTTNQRSRKARLGSAEWIAEAPSSGGVLPLANFGTVNFSACSTNFGNISGSGTVDAITMVTPGGTVKAQPSNLSGGSAFSVIWHHS